MPFDVSVAAASLALALEGDAASSLDALRRICYVLSPSDIRLLCSRSFSSSRSSSGFCPCERLDHLRNFRYSY
ncbi:hypothetical protein T492DRAFT_878181 [Pavlovales sp. CCMP2436]|nr:hypothetical protein T492DRAFT_878181 [Pavlovales sp. CCMP2436]